MIKKSAVITLAAVAIIIAGAALFYNQNQLSPTIIELTKVEVRDVNGTQLSSIADFRENSIAGPQYVNITDYRLSVTGLVQRNLSYSYEDVLSRFQSYQKVVQLDCVEGWSVKLLWQGIQVNDIIQEAGVGKEAKTIIFRAADGYSTSFPINYITNGTIMLAYKMNNVTLPPERGFPFQLVAESKWGYKWIKWVVQIEISSADYQGYWESRGYSNNGDLNSSFLGS
jgi:DMSO/TMAO reductase YedYZ molybdopterin-dependent catalytic subunit